MVDLVGVVICPCGVWAPFVLGHSGAPLPRPLKGLLASVRRSVDLAEGTSSEAFEGSRKPSHLDSVRCHRAGDDDATPASAIWPLCLCQEPHKTGHALPIVLVNKLFATDLLLLANLGSVINTCI